MDSDSESKTNFVFLNTIHRFPNILLNLSGVPEFDVISPFRPDVSHIPPVQSVSTHLRFSVCPPATPAHTSSTGPATICPHPWTWPWKKRFAGFGPQFGHIHRRKIPPSTDAFRHSGGLIRLKQRGGTGERADQEGTDQAGENQPVDFANSDAVFGG